MSRPDDLVAPVFAEEWGRLVAGLIGWCGDWELAEEAAQEAFARAVEVWPRNGVPTTPAAWLTTVARNAVRDRLRRRGTEAAKLALIAATSDDEPAPPSGFPDERLRLIFTCAHPALPMPGRVALTLRTLCGLSVVEIARAFLVTESTMDKRLVRARAKIRAAAIPYRVPPAELLPERIDGVLAVLYLLFNEGYSASSGDELLRVDLSTEAIRLARLLHRMMPEPEVTGLLALLLLTDARRSARTEHGEIVPLAEQDRSRWDRAAVDEGRGLLADLSGPPGAYEVQARIALEHDRARAAAQTDWAAIARLYELLPATPVVELNRAVAIAEAYDVQLALGMVDQLEPELAGYHLFHATRADLAARTGDLTGAIAALDEAIRLAPTGPERRLLARRRAALTAE
ncbi:RNA polymerase subunit sigma-24 [Flexivirga endophytica]|uniref:RNA polymerase subunit sigma-24 n=1 Tax=Flexivirga endophytica TaxID=1849103 RepID=A0A916SXT1_9MICO|nr:sigma-70 family RNA polymerase sigma factor [Flexivirga endophytica]GGB23140.1 RNA polymerase subunit sigma-24 [Flexivirga endophytica]GHB57065.1 RNA polymerase subunit sigma-24 [Flexivirga endophytica]